jgi:hypothetical protein
MVISSNRLSSAGGLLGPKYSVHQDEGGWRRVVVSPEARELLEMGIVRRCLEGGAVVVCARWRGIRRETPQRRPSTNAARFQV